MSSLTLDPDTEKRLEELGAKDAASKSDLVRDLVHEAVVEQTEDRLWGELVDARKATADSERTWSLEELERGDDLAS